MKLLRKEGISDWKLLYGTVSGLDRSVKVNGNKKKEASYRN